MPWLKVIGVDDLNGDVEARAYAMEVVVVTNWQASAESPFAVGSADVVAEGFAGAFVDMEAADGKQEVMDVDQVEEVVAFDLPEVSNQEME